MKISVNGLNVFYYFTAPKEVRVSNVSGGYCDIELKHAGEVAPHDYVAKWSANALGVKTLWRIVSIGPAENDWHVGRALDVIRVSERTIHSNLIMAIRQAEKNVGLLPQVTVTG